MKFSASMIALCAVLAVAGCGGSDDSTESTATTDAPVAEGAKPKVEVPSGAPPSKLVINDLRKGKGPEAKPGRDLTVQYVALRWNGEPFQSSWDSGKFDPFTFELHTRPPEVNPSWERGIPGMRVGGRRELVAPPELLYSSSQPAAETEFDPSETLVYVVEMLKIR